MVDKGGYFVKIEKITGVGKLLLDFGNLHGLCLCFCQNTAKRTEVF